MFSILSKNGYGILKSALSEKDIENIRKDLTMTPKVNFDAGGPVTRGFDEYFGTDVPNQSPYCFIENDRTVGMPSVFLPLPLLRGQLAGIGGPALEHWKLEGILPALGDRAVDFITRQAKARQRFLLYLPLTSPHTPIAPNAEWRGQSGLGNYADFVMETDALVGRPATDQAGTGGGRSQPGHDPRQGRLAGTVPAVDEHTVALVDGEAHLAQSGFGPRCSARVDVRDAFQAQHRRTAVLGVTDGGSGSGGVLHHHHVVH